MQLPVLRWLQWPRDMVIGFQPFPRQALLLLYVRSAWDLSTNVQLPPFTPAPRTGASAPPSSAPKRQWEERWDEEWRRLWEWHARMDGPAQSEPSWKDHFGSEGVDLEAYGAWVDVLIRPYRAWRAMVRHDRRERRCVVELKEAWHSGIESIWHVPFAGDFSWRATRTILVVSPETHDDERAYRRALLAGARTEPAFPS